MVLVSMQIDQDNIVNAQQKYLIVKNKLFFLKIHTKFRIESLCDILLLKSRNKIY